MSVEDLISQPADDTSPSLSYSSEVSSVVGSKRSAPVSATSSLKSCQVAADQLGHQLSGLTTQLSNLVAAMQKDYQRDAM